MIYSILDLSNYYGTVHDYKAVPYLLKISVVTFNSF